MSLFKAGPVGIFSSYHDDSPNIDIVEEQIEVQTEVVEEEEEVDEAEEVERAIRAHEDEQQRVGGMAADEYYVEEAADNGRKKYRMVRRLPATEYFCDKCQKTFRHPSKIAEHMRTHTGEKPFQCQVCGARFTQAHPLKVHMRQHRGERPFKCSYCEREFTCVSQVTQHEKVHLHGDKKAADRQGGPSAGATAGYKQQQQQQQLVDETQMYACPVVGCEMHDTNKQAVEEHIELEHADMIEQQTEEWEQQHAGNVIVADVLEGAVAGVGGVDVGGAYFPQHTADGELEMEMEGEPYGEYFGYEEQVDEACSSSTDKGKGLPVGGEQPFFDLHHHTLHVPNPTHEVEVMTSDCVLDMSGGDGLEGSGLEGVQMVGPPQAHYGFIPPQMPMRGGAGGGRIKREVAYDGELVDGEETDGLIDECERVRVFADPRPPKRGRQPLHETMMRKLEPPLELEIDSSILHMAGPIKQPQLPGRRRIRTGAGRPARNLDWIIDAVAKGIDVDFASPHNRKKPVMHECEFCGRIDKYPSKIKAHMRTHTGEKPYKCDICGMAFAQRTPMRMHVRRHLDQKPFVCMVEGCQQRFVSGALLNHHHSTKHLIGKSVRYVCLKGCGRSFVSARNQRKHEEKCDYNLTYHEPVMPYPEMEGEEEEMEEEEEMDGMDMHLMPAALDDDEDDEHSVDVGGVKPNFL